MRWDNLFDDLESQLEQELSAEDIDLQAEEERLRLSRITLRERLHRLQTASAPVRVVLTDGVTLSCRPVAVGRDWFSADILDEGGSRQQCIIPLPSVSSIVLTRADILRGISTQVSAGEPARAALTDRLGLPFVLRDLCRRRRSLEFVLPSGRVYGTIDRVGRDHFDLAVHEPGTPRRDSEVTQYRLIPLLQVILVRLRD